MTLANSLVVWFMAVLFTIPAGWPQSTSPGPAFDAASVKTNTSGSTETGFYGAMAGRYVVTNAPLRDVIEDAYRIRPYQLVDAPAWISSAHFDISATYPAGARPSGDDVNLMLRRLLADRFGLVVHQQERELPIFALVSTRDDRRLGPRLRRSTIDCEQWLANQRRQTAADGPRPQPSPAPRPTCGMRSGRLSLIGGARTMAELTAVLQSMLGRPVQDRTGLDGAFDFDLEWTADVRELSAAANAAGDAGTSIFTALQEQLGLKLENARGSVPVVVIDRVARPTPD